jgi:hypothetical protein
MTSEKAVTREVQKSQIAAGFAPAPPPAPAPVFILGSRFTSGLVATAIHE